MLIEKQNVDINIKDNDEKTPLHFACQEGNFPVVEYLISKGANIEAKDGRGQTPLHYASFTTHCDIGIVRYLISKGANKYAINNSGKRPVDLTRNELIRKILE